MSLEEARELVKGSCALLLPSCDISVSFAIDVVRKELDASVSKEAFDYNIFGSSFIP